MSERPRANEPGPAERKVLAFIKEGEIVSDATATQLAQRKFQDVTEVLHAATVAAFTVGIELGLDVAQADPVTGARMLSWIRTEIYQNKLDLPNDAKPLERMLEAFREGS